MHHNQVITQAFDKEDVHQHLSKLLPIPHFWEYLAKRESQLRLILVEGFQGSKSSPEKSQEQWH